MCASYATTTTTPEPSKVVAERPPRPYRPDPDPLERFAQREHGVGAGEVGKRQNNRPWEQNFRFTDT
jgi:hypothetical protein